MADQEFSLQSACLVMSDALFCARTFVEQANDDRPNASFFLIHDDEITVYDETVPWDAVAMGWTRQGEGPRQVVAVGALGQWWELNAKTTDESVGRIPGVTMHLRALATLDGVIHAVGMDRTAWRRDKPGSWTAMHAPAGDARRIAGFEDLDGFARAEAYAVGWEGEIWRLEAGRWTQVDSPVSAHLRAVCCAADGMVYAVGDNGTLVRGRHDRWERVDTGRGENLKDVKWFDGSLYVVTDFRILKLVDGALLNDDAFDSESRPVTCLYLLAFDDALVSAGPLDLYRRTASTGWAPWTYA